MLTGLLLGFTTSVCWALGNVAVQRSSRAVGPIRALLWSQLIGIGLVVLATPFVDRPTAPVSAGIIAWVAVAGVSGLVGYVCMFYAFEHGRLTVSVPIMSSWAVPSTGLSLVLFDKGVSGGQLAGAASVIAGAIVVAASAQRGSAVGANAPESGPRWLLASFGAAIGFGVLIPSMGRLVPAFGSVGAVGVVYAAVIAVGLPLALVFRIPLGAPRGASWTSTFLAGLSETAGFVALAFASRLASLAIVSPLASLAAPLTVLYAWVFLRERPPRATLLGAALVCGGIVALAL